MLYRAPPYVLEAHLYRFLHASDKKPDTIAEVLTCVVDPDDAILAPGYPLVLGPRTFDVFRIEQNRQHLGQLQMTLHTTWVLLLFGHVGDGVWYKYRARCTMMKR